MRILTIALAIPLVGLAACSTGSTQGSRTARTDRQGAAVSGEAQASAGGASGSANANSSTTAGTPSAHGNVSTPGSPDAPAGATAGNVEGSYGNGTASGSASTGSGSMGTSSGSADAQAGLKAHSDDKVVMGKITKLSPESLTIAADDGDHTLKLVPQTTIQVDGRDAAPTSLSEGLPVRASFSTVEGQDVAVEIHAQDTNR